MQQQQQQELFRRGPIVSPFKQVAAATEPQDVLHTIVCKKAVQGKCLLFNR
jgi:hypothetical protein